MFNLRVFKQKKLFSKKYCQITTKNNSSILNFVGKVCYIAACCSVICYILYKGSNLVCIFDNEKALEYHPYRYETYRFEMLFDMVKTQKMCTYVVTKKPHLIKCVPEKFKNDEICDIIIKYPALLHMLPTSKLNIVSLPTNF